ncbi:MAG: hypothetical protein NC331_01665 [Lachnospiraceae bacterium]|nr:hypothetical protein [Lachnospiraceae bacterium]MCM1238074.1 hypothetical protein [Lachnospiraceae bacterium]
MNSQDIFNGVTDIRDDLITGATSPKRQRRRILKRWSGAVAAMLAVAILAGIFLRPGVRLTAYAIAQAKYPKMASYPSGPAQLIEPLHDAWWEDVKAQRRDLGDITPLQDFFRQSAQVFLNGAGENDRVYSPLNVYMALSMLAQLTDGESREQILTLLGSDSMDALRQQASDVWNCNYRDDGALTSILASSLWLDRDVKFDQDTMDILARDFYASSYRGKMGSEQFNKALQSWLNEQTGGLLEEQAGNIELDSDTILALASTVYFRAKWHTEFSKGKTTPQTFHTPAGDVETDFMHQRDNQSYFWGDTFAAVSQPFSQGGSMWFLLPDEGITPEELLSDGEAMDFLFAADRYEWKNQKFLYVNKSIPKFDVASQLDLKEGLQALGITDIFDPALSDFAPMTADVEEPIVLSQSSHAARVTIDEEGCTATAFTAMAAAGSAAPPDDEVDFVLDRPFLFCITGDSGLPLFVGIVNSP